MGIEIFVDGIGDPITQGIRGKKISDIKKVLIALPQEAKDQCHMIVNKTSERISLRSALQQAKPLIRVVGETSNPALLTVAEALDQLNDSYDLLISDGVDIGSYREFLKAIGELQES